MVSDSVLTKSTPPHKDPSFKRNTDMASQGYSPATCGPNSSQQMEAPVAAPTARRSRAGCQQCRRRKRKCDEQHPRCAACLQRGLECIWQRDEPRRQQVARRQLQQNKDFTVPQEMRPLVTIFTVPPASIQQRLLSYFCANSPLWITAGGDANSMVCLDAIVPVALRSPLVFNCVLALAAGDMSKYQPASSGLASLTQGFYGQAVSGIHSAVNNELSNPGRGQAPAQTGNRRIRSLVIMCNCQPYDQQTTHCSLSYSSACTKWASQVPWHPNTY
jgi:hypothetical protein